MRTETSIEQDRKRLHKIIELLPIEKAKILVNRCCDSPKSKETEQDLWRQLPLWLRIRANFVNTVTLGSSDGVDLILTSSTEYQIIPRITTP